MRTGLSLTALIAMLAVGFLVLPEDSAQPVSSTAAQAVGPEIQHWQLDNGTRVYFVATDALPIVDVRVMFSAGAARDGESPGLARLTNSLLSQGAGGLDADAIARGFEQTGARFSTGSERDMAWLEMRSLSRQEALEPALENFTRVLTAPDFPPAALERQRARMLVGLQAQQQSPGALGERALYEALYGDHPYGSPPEGTEEALRAIDRDDVVGFYRRYYVASNAVVAIVGDLDRAQAQALARQLTGELSPGEPVAEIPPPAPPAEGRIVHVPFQSAQTHVLIGMIGIDRHSEAYFPLKVGNHILGGSGLVSILANRMREERGLSYSSYSYFVPSAAAGPYIIGTQVRADRTEEALRVLGRTFREFRKHGPSPAQLEAAQSNITGSFPLSLDSNSKIVGQIASMGFYRMPLDYLAEYTDKVRAVTDKDIQQALQQRLDPEKAITVLVGPRNPMAEAKQ